MNSLICICAFSNMVRDATSFQICQYNQTPLFLCTVLLTKSHLHFLIFKFPMFFHFKFCTFKWHILAYNKTWNIDNFTFFHRFLSVTAPVHYMLSLHGKGAA